MLRNHDNIDGIFRLWLNWILVSSSLAVLVVVSLWIPPVIMPLIAFALQGGFDLYIKFNKTQRLHLCLVLPFLATRIMFWTGLSMLIVNILYSRWMIGKIFDEGTINTEIPFITVLILSLSTLIVTAFALLKKGRLGFCEKCKIRNGSPGERGFLGNLFSQEGKYQINMLFKLSALVAIGTWGYYFFEYVNINLNKPDRYVFFWAPIAITLFSIGYITVRYISLWKYYSVNLQNRAESQGRYTLLRYLVFHEDTILVRPPVSNPDITYTPEKKKYDTPANIFIPYRERVPLHEAIGMFNNLSGLQDTEIRLMYINQTGNVEGNIFHYFSFITTEQRNKLETSFPNLQFKTIAEIQKLLNSGKLENLFSAEIVRLYTIAMTWKTYTPEGKRKWKYKEYQPLFRLKDLKGWDVDFNDNHWLEVARVNEDKRFFKIRRFWNKYFGKNSN